MNESLVNLLRRAAAIQRDGRRLVGCLVVNARGSTPQPSGALMLVDDAANIYGTVGGGCVEAEIRRRAFQMLNRGETGLMRFKLDHDYGWDDGLICGGTLELAVAPLPDPDELDRVVSDIEQHRATSLTLHLQTEGEPANFTLSLPPRERLYIAGAGHVGQAIARHGLRLDFDVTVFDDRPDMLKRFAPDEVTQVSGDIAAQLANAPIDRDTYCIIVTRGHRHDEQALEAVLGRGAKYIGMIGSRRKVKLVFDDLIDRGVPRQELAKVHAPIGLDIDAVTVEEIAVSIVAQLVKVRRQTRRAVVDGPQSRPQTPTQDQTIPSATHKGKAK
ncbi:MAG: XdhC/CoxI family protein [Phycisphaeraceae bacterium]